MMHGHEVAVKPANKVAPHCGAVRGGVSRSGVGGAKGVDQGECGLAKHALDSAQARVSQALERIRQLLAVWTRGGSRMRESRTYGFVRGARGNSRPYRVPGSPNVRWHSRDRRLPRRRVRLLGRCGSVRGRCGTAAHEPNRTPTALVALGSRPAVQRIVPGPGDGVFDAGEVIVEQFLGSRTGDDRGSAIGRRHGNLCGHEGAGQIGSIFGARHGSVSYCVPIWSLPCRFLNRTEVDPDHAFVFPTHTSVMSASYSGCPAHCFRLGIGSCQLTANSSCPGQSLAISARPRKSRNEISAGMIERGERKGTADDVSKADCERLGVKFPGPTRR
jgi:hypothetical protein